MAFKCWQLGLHLQQDTVYIVALQRTRCGWALKRWWQLPLPAAISPEPTDEALIAALMPWRRQLPWQHTVSIAFPANRTLQKTLPRAAMTLRENEQKQWLASAMSQQLEMAANSLCFDYHLAEPQQMWNVTAAQQHDVSRLQRLAQRLQLQIVAITPDACALQTLLPFVQVSDAVLVLSENAQWLWASREAWGHMPHQEAPSLTRLGERLGIEAHQLVCCGSAVDAHSYFDPWSPIIQKQPPLPVNDAPFTVAIALAMGASWS